MTGRLARAGASWRLAGRFAWRETRGAGGHFTHVLACVALGVAAIVAVGSLGASVDRTVARSARSLLGGDVEIRSTRPLSAGAHAAVARLAGARVAQLELSELAAMARAGDESLLAEVKAVPPGYPLYGELTTDPGLPLDRLIGGGRVLVHESLLARLGLRVGDRLRLGEAEFTVSGRVLVEPDRSAGVFSLGPRALIAAADLPATGLVQPGSRVRHRILFRLPAGADADAFRDALAERLPDPGLRVTTFRQAQPGLRRFWDQLTTYLGLTGLVALLVGGIGVGTSVSAFIRRKLATIAILKCLGAPWQGVLRIYLAQTAGLGVAGSLLGAALGSLLQPALVPLLGPLLPLTVESGVAPLAVLRGLAMGVGVTIGCALWPLLEVRRVPPAFVLRRDVDLRARARPRAAVVPIALGLAALGIWQAGSWKLGGLFVAGAAGGLVLLLVASRAVIALARRLPARRSLAWRQALANLHRPGSHAAPVLVTLGLAVMLIVAVALLEANLRGELAGPGRERAPAFFFIDVQPDQAAPLADVVARAGGERPELIPIVRARLAAIRGAPVERPSGARAEERWYLTREYVLTWAATPPAANRVIAGRWWTPEEAAREPLISVEEEIAKSLGVRLGDILTFDVQGVPVSARVTSLRKVDWHSLGANFFVIFSPGRLDGAPATYLATARARPQAERAVQAAVVAAFPNVTAIPVRELLERVGAVVDQIAFAVRLVAAVSLGAGLVVLAGALGITRAERLYHSVILKALGARRGAVARMFAAEYALLGGTAGLAGTALAAALAWAVQRWVFEVPWSWQPAILATGVALSTALALAVGFLGTFRLLGQAPLAVLRGE